MQEVNPMTVATPQVAAEQPKQSNFLTILLSVLLIISVSISGFFAYQTQKLVKELTSLKNQEKVVAVATAEPIVEPIATEVSENDSTANWKTYTNNAFGSNFSLKYPTTFKIKEEVSTNAVYVYLKKDNINNFTFEFVKQETDNFLSQLPIIKTFEFNDLKWSSHKSTQYCDGGECGPVSASFTLKKDGLIISYIPDKSNDDALSEQILSTFKFLD